MNIADAIGFSALVIGVISVSGIWLDAYKRRLTNREKEMELEVRRIEAEAARGSGRVGAVEERLRVLERIATDPQGRLAHEIESLREREIAQ